MRVACHFAIPRPPHLELDAAVQDGLKIVAEVGGEVNFLYPGKKANVLYPRFFSGFQQLPHLIKLDRRVDVHHVFSNGFYPYPIFSFLKKPILLSTVISLQQNKPIKFPRILQHIKQFIVPTHRDQQIMWDWGYENVSVVIPGIELSNFSFSSCKMSQSKFVLLMGSAPWNKNQFDTKGIDSLLQVMKELQWLKVVFLWRGLLLEEMMRRVETAGVQDRVVLITDHVDVDNVLAGVHAAIILAENMQIVKAYPHSLLEAMAAGKPVIVSECLQVSDFVKNNNCGEVVSMFDSNCLKTAVQSLKNNYVKYCQSVKRAPIEEFSSYRMINEFKKLYCSVLFQ
jgi:glycosyltransferase involved in cell wall biosynthesis